jgi:hypothetical protein
MLIQNLQINKSTPKRKLLDVVPFFPITAGPSFGFETVL